VVLPPSLDSGLQIAHALNRSAIRANPRLARSHYFPVCWAAWLENQGSIRFAAMLGLGLGGEGL